MEIKLTQAQYDAIKNGLITSSFEMLDVNNDGSITNVDLSLTQDSKIKNEIEAILSKADTEEELQTFTLDEINQLIATANNAENTLATGNKDVNNTTGGSFTIAGVETIDVTNIKKNTAQELQDKLTKIANNITLIQAEIDKLKEEETKLNKEKTTIDEEREAKVDVLEDANEEVELHQRTLVDYIGEYDNYKEEIERINNQIRAQQEMDEITYQKHIAKVTSDAIANYDPAEHGDNFQAYFNKQIDSSVFTVSSALNTLNTNAAILSTGAQNVLRRITDQTTILSSAVSTAQVAQTAVDDVTARLNVVIDKINTNTSKINSANALLETNKIQQTQITQELNSRVEGGGMTGDEVLAKISDAEKKLAIDNNIDLTQCFVAMGADGNWHIYQSDGTSLARQYGQQRNGLTGSDIVPNGSGYVRNKSEAEIGTDGAKAIYTFSEVNADLTSGTATFEAFTYSTSSPLAFDINGDGVKTSTSKVNFDIDGDGQIDVVNNAADWVLAFDNDGNGKVGENGSELFGDNTDLDGDGKKDGYANGFEALKALAEKEGLISNNDRKLDESDLKKLEEKYGLKMTNGYGGEAKSLSDLGITEINLAKTNKTTLQKNFDGQHNDLMTQEGATFVVNGETRSYADIWNRKYEASIPDENGMLQKVKNTIQAKSANLNFNLGFMPTAIKGKVDYDKIKNDAYATDIPQEILEEIIKLEEEE